MLPRKVTRKSLRYASHTLFHYIISFLSSCSQTVHHDATPSFSMSMPCLASVANSASVKEALSLNTSVSFDARLNEAMGSGIAAEGESAKAQILKGTAEVSHSFIVRSYSDSLSLLVC